MNHHTTDHQCHQDSPFQHVCSGDLAMLLAAGWPVRRLALFSMLSAVLGYVGVLTGTVLGHQWAHHSPWILTLTAGVFLYVALTDMVRKIEMWVCPSSEQQYESN